MVPSLWGQVSTFLAGMTEPRANECGTNTELPLGRPARRPVHTTTIRRLLYSHVASVAPRYFPRIISTAFLGNLPHFCLDRTYMTCYTPKVLFWYRYGIKKVTGLVLFIFSGSFFCLALFGGDHGLVCGGRDSSSRIS